MKRYIFSLTFLFSLTNLYSQDSTNLMKQGAKPCRWQKAFFGLVVGGYGETPYHSKYNPNPENRFLKSGQNGIPFNKDQFNLGNNTNAGGVFLNPYISFRPWNQKRKIYNENQELRLGIILNSNSGRTITYENKFDPGGQLDTTLTSNVSFENKRDDLGLNVGYVVISDVVKYRFSLYSGVDLGVSYSVTHSVLQTVKETTYKYSSSYYYNDVAYSNDRYKELKGISSLTVRGSILAGMNVRIMDPVTLFSEGKVGYSYIQPLGQTALMQVYYNFNVGFKFRI